MGQTDHSEQTLERKMKEIEKTIPEKRTQIDFQKLEQIIQKWLLIKDPSIIKVIVGTVIANKLSSDPVWLFIVAPPGGTKTELIRGLNKVDGIYPISDLTPQTFLSGEKSSNASLLLRIPSGTIFTYKDFTTVLSMHYDKQQAIISQFREIFDGSYRKEFGTGQTKSWEGKIGFIAGVTPVIDRHREIYSVLGERFVQYRPVHPDSIALAKKAMANSGGEKIMREEIQNAFADFLTGIAIPKDPIVVPEEIQDKIAHLAAFVVRARSGVLREGYHTREIELIPDTELPTRLPKQLSTLFCAFGLTGDNASDKENYELILKMGMDCLPQTRRRTIKVFMEIAGIELETADVATRVGYPTNTARRALEDLQGLGLVERHPGGQGRADKWLLNDLAIRYLTGAGVTLPEKSDDLTQEITNPFDNLGGNTLPEISGE